MQILISLKTQHALKKTYCEATSCSRQIIDASQATQHYLKYHYSFRCDICACVLMVHMSKTHLGSKCQIQW